MKDHLKFQSITKIILISLLSLTFMGSCQSIQDVLNSIQKPTLSVDNIKLGTFNFQEMELIYEVRINNPNSVSLQMQDYTYKLDINSEPFLNGDQSRGLQIDANGSSVVEVPLLINFNNLFNTVRGVAQQDESTYQFESTMAFDIPVLGRTEVPVSKSGTIPVIKRPTIKINSLDVQNLSFSSADLQLNLSFENPNGFGLRINGLNYDLNIDQTEWASGQALQNVTLEKNKTTELQIPFSVNITSIGLSAYRMLQGSESPNYDLSGTFDFTVLHELLGKTELSFQRSGEIPLSR